MTRLALLSAAPFILALAACGGGDPEVRNGPQLVHPSPSALAQGLVAEPAAVATECGAHTHHCHAHAHTHHKHHGGNDGSQPIID